MRQRSISSRLASTKWLPGTEKAEQACQLWIQAYPRSATPHNLLSGAIYPVTGQYEQGIAGQAKAKAHREVLAGIGLQSTLSGHSFQAFPFSHSFLVQHEQSKQQREIEDGSKEQLACAGNRALKGKTSAVVEKHASKKESPCKVDNP